MRLAPASDDNEAEWKTGCKDGAVFKFVDYKASPLFALPVLKLRYLSAPG